MVNRLDKGLTNVRVYSWGARIEGLDRGPKKYGSSKITEGCCEPGDFNEGSRNSRTKYSHIDAHKGCFRR